MNEIELYIMEVDFFVGMLLVFIVNLLQNPLIQKKTFIIKLRNKMCKSQKEDKTKRYSKISNALKSYFFKLIYVKQMTIKEAARICRLNYSTAKAIIRDLTDKEKEYIDKQISSSRIMKQLNFSQNFERSDYRQTSCSNDDEVSRTIFGQVANYHGLLIPKPIKRINVISTTGYDFLSTSNIKVGGQY